MRLFLLRILLLFHLSLSLSGKTASQSSSTQPSAQSATTLFTHIHLIDGTGIPARNASVRIKGPYIIAVGNLTPLPGETIIDGNGKYLAPGFIDTHSHLASTLFSNPNALAAVNQGVTTIVAGQDGESDDMDTLTSRFNIHPPAINVASYTGQTTLREKVLGNGENENQLHRPATPEEITKMQTLLQTELQKGSLGLSTGLEYEGAHFSTPEEVIALAKIAAAANARYISHMRSEDIDLDQAITEIINIGKQAALPVQISHIKIALKDKWGQAPAIITRLDSARNAGINITADCYPYTYWSSTLKVLFPKTDYTNPVSAQFAVDHTFDPANSFLTRFAPQPAYIGKSIAAIARQQHQSIAATLIALIAQTEAYRKAHPDSSGVEAIVATSMQEDDLRNFLAWPQTNICSDGSDGGHPRGYGTFTRVLGQYTRDQQLLRWEEAIHKMTALSAEHTGIKNRGIIAPGWFADLTLFDPSTIKDNAIIGHARELSDGILGVWVNGICVYKDHHPTNQYPGTLITR